MANIIVNISDFISNLDVFTESLLSDLGIWGALASCLLIMVESILPVLPLCVFVTIIFFTFGKTIGFFLSWIFTSIGCFLSFTLTRKLFRKKFVNHFFNKKDSKKLKKLMGQIEDMSVSSIAILVAIPFTPACVVNVAASLTNISTKKFMTAIIIGKTFMIYFWGYIGLTLIECLTHPIYIVRIFIMLFLAFIVSKLISKYFNIE